MTRCSWRRAGSGRWRGGRRIEESGNAVAWLFGLTTLQLVHTGTDQTINFNQLSRLHKSCLKLAIPDFLARIKAVALNMFAEAAKTFLEFLKLAPRYLIVIALGVIAAILLFADVKLLELIGISELAKENRPLLGLTLVVTTALFLASVIGNGIALVKKWWIRKRHHKRIKNRLHSLTEGEKQILRYYIAENTRANTLRIDDGIVQGLKASGIIHLSASMGNALEGFAHNISEFAFDYLQLHPHLLDGTTDTYRTDKRNRYW